jgi:hypothetical protein
MGIIILIILVLLGLSSTRSGSQEAVDAWRSQSQLQMSRRQTDLHETNLRHEMNLRPIAGYDRLGGRSLSPGARGDEARSKPPRRSPELGKRASADDSDKYGAEDDAEDEAELAKLISQEKMAKLFGRDQKPVEEEDDAVDDEDDIGLFGDENSDLDDKADGFMSLYHAIFDSDDDLFPKGASPSARVHMCGMPVNVSAPEMHVRKEGDEEGGEIR